MPQVDLTVEIVRMRDENPYQRDGTILHQKAVDFFIGKFGPFTERFDRDTFSDAVVQERIGALKRTLETLHR